MTERFAVRLVARSIAGALALAAAALSPADADARQTPPPWCAIEGRVLDAHGLPVADARVQLTIDGTNSVSVESDSQGQYLIALAKKWSAHTAELSASAAAGSATGGITIRAGRNASDLRLAPARSSPPNRPVDTSFATKASRTLFFATDRVASSDGFGVSQDTRLHYGSFAGSAELAPGDCALFPSWSCAPAFVPRGTDATVGASVPQPAGSDVNAEEQIFLQQIQAGVARQRAPRILLFIHGFNESFAQAQSAMVRFVLSSGWDASPAILYSWPSQGSLKRYLADSETVSAPETLSDFEHVVTKLLNLPARPQLFLTAHSMGNRLLINALRDLPQIKGHVAAIAYIAADVREADFNFSARALETVATRQKVYASHNDIALRISDCHNDSRRLGEGPTSLAPGIALFDATNVATPQEWGHSYFGNTLPVAQDLNAFVGGAHSGVAQALSRLRWLGVRASPALDMNEVLFESAFACSVVQTLGY